MAVAIRIWQQLTRYFLAGLLAVLPLVITVAVVMWVSNFIQRFIGPDTLLGGWLKSLGVQIAEGAPGLVAYAVGWSVVLLAIFGLGVVIELGAKRMLHNIISAIVTRVPIVGSIYNTSRQVVDMLDRKDEANLEGMSPVFCKFGENGAAVLALLVSPETYTIDGRDYNIVVIPTAPVPFGGGLVFMPAASVSPADMPVDGLMSIYVSMGVTAPDYMTKAN